MTYIRNIPEPELLFGRGTAICPKRGIRTFYPYDIDKVRPQIIRLGVIGKSESIDKILTWLGTCKSEIVPKNSRLSNLFPGFMGFTPEKAFSSQLVYDDSYLRKINNSDFDDIFQKGTSKSIEELIELTVELYLAELKYLAKNKNPDVVICALPEKLSNYFLPVTQRDEDDEEDERLPTVSEDDESEENVPNEKEQNFRRLLKAKAMQYGLPIQIVRDRIAKPTSKGLQDPATVAWNFFTALYYKASGTPWGLQKFDSSIVCFAGISFYKSRDRSTTQTSIAQIFDELGKGVILRGEDPIKTRKDDPVPHLSGEQAFKLMDAALEEYRQAVKTAPQRLVVHKTSNYNQAEIDGLEQAAQKHKIHALDLISIQEHSNYRLFRDGQYPVIRGTHLAFDDTQHLVYTRGSVPFYETFTGKYIPDPLSVKLFKYDESPDVICNEVLALTKMNWNNAQFDRKLPITLQCAKNVGEILKYLGPDDTMELRYSFYM